jgi:hypothetical protein
MPVHTKAGWEGISPASSIPKKETPVPELGEVLKLACLYRIEKQLIVFWYGCWTFYYKSVVYEKV